MLKSVTANTKTGVVEYEYCRMHTEYPNCTGCPLRASNGVCLDWLKEEVVE